MYLALELDVYRFVAGADSHDRTVAGPVLNYVLSVLILTIGCTLYTNWANNKASHVSSRANVFLTGETLGLAHSKCIAV